MSSLHRLSVTVGITQHNMARQSQSRLSHGQLRGGGGVGPADCRGSGGLRICRGSSWTAGHWSYSKNVHIMYIKYRIFNVWYIKCTTPERCIESHLAWNL